MRIGIDIDDTIVDTWETLIPIYSKKFNVPIEELKKSEPYYRSIKNKLTIEEYFNEVRTIHDEMTPSTPLKPYVKEVLDKLHQEGNTIIFITSRGDSHTDAEAITKEYLKCHEIPYDKLVLKAKNKALNCEEEKIDLFIDDSNKHCEAVSLKGIDVLQYETNYNKNNKKHKHVHNWHEVYEYIQRR